MKTTNRIYESMYIVDSGTSEEDLESIVAKYSQLVTDQGGTVTAAGRWDKRRLAYDVKGHGDGIFVLMFFEGTPEAAKELDRVFRISDDVFRHLITRVEPEHVDISRIGQPTAEEIAQEAREAAAAQSEAAADEPASQVVEEAGTSAPSDTAAAEEIPVTEDAAAPAEEAVPVTEDAPAAEEAEMQEAEEPAPVEEAAEEPTAEQPESATEPESEDKKEE